jgi:aldehyde:ferredoxin oxidoreductase
MTIFYENMSFIRDSTGICLFAVNTTNAIGSNYITKLLSSYLGLSFSPAATMKTGERILNLIKAYNIREGLTRSDDSFSGKFFCEPMNNLGPGGPVLSGDYINGLLDAYYELRGWDRKTGKPTKEKLEELGLDSVANELINRGII